MSECSDIVRNCLEEKFSIGWATQLIYLLEGQYREADIIVFGMAEQ